MPPERWTNTSDTLILHGRRICKPKPLCPKCAVRPDCHYYKKVVSKLPAGPTFRSGVRKQQRAK